MLLSRSVRSVARCSSRCDASRPLSLLANRPPPSSPSLHVARAVTPTCAWSAYTSSGSTSTSGTSRRTHPKHPKHASFIGVPAVGIQPFSTKPDSGDSSKDDKDDCNGAGPPSSPSPPSFVETSLRGTGQVIFLNSSASGALILGGLAVADPYLATMALAGVTTSTLAASVGGLDRQALSDGLYGYNGALVGCAVSVFLHPLPAASLTAMDLQTLAASPEVIHSASWALASTVMGASLAPYVSVGLKEAMGGVPQWTVAFNLIALGALLRTKPLAVAADEGPGAAAAAEVATATMSVLEAPLRGISQIFVVDSSLSGAAIVGATALYSPGLAGHLLLGSAVGSLTGYTLCSAPIEEITCGLWGYNSALT